MKGCSSLICSAQEQRDVKATVELCELGGRSKCWPAELSPAKLFKQEHAVDWSWMATGPHNIIRCVSNLQLSPVEHSTKSATGLMTAETDKKKLDKVLLLDAIRVQRKALQGELLEVFASASGVH